jgi:copper chaperone
MMEKTVLAVDGMSCQHCVKAIKEGVGALPGVKKVDVDLGKKSVTVKHELEKCSIGAIKAVIDELGYEVQS